MRAIEQCRDCGSSRLYTFLDLGAQPPANRLLGVDQLTEPEPAYPLALALCEDCHSVQLTHVVDKEELFHQDYVYYSATIPKISRYWQGYAEDVIQRLLTPAANQFVLEVGSNDGVLLKFFQEQGYRVLGVDPSKNVATVAQEQGVETIVDFFSTPVAEQVKEKYGQPDVILANNVFAHIDDHQDFCRAASLLLPDHGALVIELPYLLDMFENLTYDTIYHEHLSYVALRPLAKLLSRYNLEIFDAAITPAFGQSIRIFIGRPGAHPLGAMLNDLLQRELQQGLHLRDSYDRLAARIAASRDRLAATVKDLRAQGKRIVGYGSPARASTLMNYAGLGADTIEALSEVFPSKYGKFSPGQRVPIRRRDEVFARQPDYAVLFTWNYLPQVMEQEKAFREAGGKFIIPIGDDIKII